MNRISKTLLVTALIVVVLMAFRVSWNALREVATTVGADPVAALLYPFVVDGLMALALVATLVLVGRDRAFALRVLAGYTLASLVLNYVHGLAPEMYGAASRMQLADWSVANWLLVLLATSLPVGSIFFGSDLVAKVLHQRPAATAPVPAAAPRTPAAPGHAYAPERESDPEPVRDRTHRPYGDEAAPTAPAYTQVTRPAQVAEDLLGTALSEPSADTDPEGRTAASRAYDEAEWERKRQLAQELYAESLAAGQPIGPAALGREFGLSEGWGRKQIRAYERKRADGPKLQPHPERHRQPTAALANA